MLGLRQWLDEGESWREWLLRLPHAVGALAMLGALGGGGVVLWRAWPQRC